MGFRGQEFSVANASEVDILHQPLMLELSKLKRQAYQLDLSLDDFFFAAALAKRNLSPKAQDFPFETDYQYQVDANCLFTLLQKIAKVWESSWSSEPCVKPQAGPTAKQL